MKYAIFAKFDNIPDNLPMTSFQVTLVLRPSIINYDSAAVPEGTPLRRINDWNQKYFTTIGRTARIFSLI